MRSLHELLKVGNIVLRSFANTITNHIAAIANEIVSWRCTFKVGCAVTNHHDFKLAIGLQLTRVETSDLSDSFAFASTSTRRLVHIKSSVVPIEVKQEFVGEKIVQWYAQLLGNWIDKSVKSSRDEVDLLVVFSQTVDEISRKEKAENRGQ